MEFIEAPAFARYLSEYLSDDEYRRLQTLLTVDPERGDLMPGTGGFRKLRWADPKRGKGQRGWIAHHLLLLFVRSANMVDDALRQG